MLTLSKGRYAARFAETLDDLRAAQALRWKAFVGARGLAGEAGAPGAEPLRPAAPPLLAPRRLTPMISTGFAGTSWLRTPPPGGLCAASG